MPVQSLYICNRPKASLNVSLIKNVYNLCYIITQILENGTKLYETENVWKYHKFNHSTTNKTNLKQAKHAKIKILLANSNYLMRKV